MINIKPAKKRDLLKLIEIEKNVFNQSMSIDDYDIYFNEDTIKIWKVLDQIVVGFIVFRTVFNEALFGISFAFCAGIMVYVALNELLPVAKEYGEPSDTIIGVTIGMIIMAVSLIMMYA